MLKDSIKRLVTARRGTLILHIKAKSAKILTKAYSITGSKNKKLKKKTHTEFYMGTKTKTRM